MRFVSTFLIATTLLLLLPLHTAAEEWSMDWQVDLGDGYITTSPVMFNEHLFVRTSGFWTGEERPQVFSLTTQGIERWNRTSPTTIQHDLSPLQPVSSGQGECGNWPDLLLIGWADGVIEAVHPSNGSLAWSATSSVNGWGITGAMALDGDHVIVPTRNGMQRHCLSDGTLDFSTNLSLGWRNGVLATPDGYWQGDEQGRLWMVNRNGSLGPSVDFGGSIRHAPLAVPTGLLLHVQYPMESKIMHLETNTLATTTLLISGPSPAIPIQQGNLSVFGDSKSITSVRCEASCIINDQIASTMNGEFGWSPSSQIYAPINTPEGGWLVIQVNSQGSFVSNSTFTTEHDGYGTAAPAFGASSLFLGNDAGWLMAHTTSSSTEDAPDYDWTPLLGAMLIIIFSTVLAVLTRSNGSEWGLRLFAIMVLSLSLLLLPDVSQQWSERLPAVNEPTAQGSWDSSWPESWLGTQVVVVDFGEENKVTLGGFLGHDTVESLTQAALEEAGLLAEIEQTDLGPYLISIDGQSGGGWEYFVDGERGVLAIDSAGVESTTILHWRMV
ncbi:MAG: hypothetical protein DWC01_01465 [Candidatus Poseidoniales archaeon]|nr:MAG: hypothetical protein DWC01_01465 [Candidatus Poseidoniales archaeon]